MVIQIGPDLYVHQPGSIYSPWGYLTEGLGAGGELAEGKRFKVKRARQHDKNNFCFIQCFEVHSFVLEIKQVYEFTRGLNVDSTWTECYNDVDNQRHTGKSRKIYDPLSATGHI